MIKNVKDVLDFIKQYFKKHQQFPTRKTLMVKLTLENEMQMKSIMHELINDGYVRAQRDSWVIK